MTKQVPIYDRAGRGLYAQVDDKDFDRFAQYRWRLSSRGYAIRSYVDEGKEIVLSLHREILQPPPGLQVDHVSRDRIDDRRVNLRLVTPGENNSNRARFKSNRSGYKGVTYLHHKWHAQIQKDKQDIHLGFWGDIKAAAQAYDCAASLLFGKQVAWLNFPDEPTPDAIYQAVIGYLTKALT